MANEMSMAELMAVVAAIPESAAAEAIEAAHLAQEVKESIPEDYSELSADVAEIKGAYAAKTDTVLETTLSRYRKANTVVGAGSFSFGIDNEASGDYSHAEGQQNVAAGTYSHAEGRQNTATSAGTHVEGRGNVASAAYAHAEGNGTVASGAASHTEGYSTIANHRSQSASGEFNVADGSSAGVTEPGTYVNIVGNGTDGNNRSNAYALGWDGNGHYMGDVYVGFNADSSGGTKLVKDVQVNGASAVADGVADIPLASSSVPGVVRVNSNYGFEMDGTAIRFKNASDAQLKAGANQYRTISPSTQHQATFYGLAKAAGDATQSASDNPVGTYTDDAKAAIKTMLGVTDSPVQDVQVNGTSVLSDGVANIVIDHITPSTINPKQLQAIVAAGKAKENFNIGDVIYIPWMNYTPDTPVMYQFPFVVAHIGDVYDQNDVLHKDALWLMAMYAEPEEIVFDAPENTVVDLTEEPNALAGWYYWGKSGTSYTELQLETGAAIPTTYDSVHKCGINNLTVLRYGYNRWKDSAYRQWLNSMAAKNANWWTSQHTGDVAPADTYTNMPGWLYGFEDRWLNIIKPVKVQTATNTVTDGGVTDVTYDRFFLPSLEQMYGVPQADGVEGDYWEYWKEETGLNEPSNGSSSGPNDARKIPSVANYPRGSAVYCRLRSAYRDLASSACGVHAGGYLNSSAAAVPLRSLPACVIY